MPERIYTSAEDGALEALEETPSSTEDELQALIAEHPELLDGEQTSPGDARRWILITREKGIVASSGAAARWAVDHLIIDQDAVPTLAELKRGSNPEIRRTIVGQLLEYRGRRRLTLTLSFRIQRCCTLRGHRGLEERFGPARDRLATGSQLGSKLVRDLKKSAFLLITSLSRNK